MGAVCLPWLSAGAICTSRRLWRIRRATCTPWQAFCLGRAGTPGKLRRFGYLTLKARRESLYGPAGTELRGHEFHYFDTEDPGEDFEGVKPVRGAHWRCIHARGNLLCGFPHAYLYSNPACAAHFLEACRRWGKEAEG